MWELNPLVMSINKLDVNNNADDVAEWYINEKLDLTYFSVFASDSVSSDTSTDVDNDPWSAMDALTSLHVPMKSSLKTYQDVGDVQESVFMIPARRKGQKSILFGRIKSELMSREDLESENESPQFSHYEPNVLRRMERMGYDLTNGPGLNFSIERRILLRSSFRKGRHRTITIKLAGVWAMCQLQFHQPPSLKSHYTIIIHLALYRGSRMLVSATSSENFQ